MENELRYYYSYDNYEKLINKLKKFKELTFEGCFNELTIQYDHPIEENSFYQKAVDGRFRVRMSKEINNRKTKAKISWKRRTNKTTVGIVNCEEEVEVNFNYDEFNSLKFLLENVIKMKRIESYERYRNIFSNEDIEIVVDKYPFGIALEIENKSKSKNPEKMVLYWVNKMNLNIKDAFRLSWDDKYTQLCQNQGIKIYKDVVFGKKMPMVVD